jgi:CCR4-NOT transcription complex subunit 1
VPVTVVLLRSGLINLSLQDQQLAKLLFEDPRPTLLSFAANLIRECLSSDPPVATQGQFGYMMDVSLAQAAKTNKE